VILATLKIRQIIQVTVTVVALFDTAAIAIIAVTNFIDARDYVSLNFKLNLRFTAVASLKTWKSESTVTGT
jgi:hypothetical protein